MSAFRLFVDSSTGIDINPEYNYKNGGEKIEDVYRSPTGAPFRYIWGDFNKIDFGLSFINEPTKTIINDWWDETTDLYFMEVGVEASVKQVHITNRSKPIDRNIKPYRSLFKGKIILETYSRAFYRTGSIYGGTKDVTTEWLYEKQATGVNAIKVKDGTVNVNIGWGSTPAEAMATKKTVSSSGEEIISISCCYIAWQGTTGTVFIEQSVIR